MSQQDSDPFGIPFTLAELELALRIALPEPQVRDMLDAFQHALRTQRREYEETHTGVTASDAFAFGPSLSLDTYVILSLISPDLESRLLGHLSQREGEDVAQWPLWHTRRAELSDWVARRLRELGASDPPARGD